MYWVVFGCVLLLLTRNWKPSRMASSCTNAADFDGKLSISSSVKIPLRRFRSFFDGKGGSVCEFWGSIDALREWPVWNLNRLHVWKSSWVGVQLGKGWQCKNRSDEGLTLETSAFFYPLRWLIYVFNPVVNTKLPTFLSSGVICRWNFQGRRSLNSSLTAHLSNSPNEVSFS